MYLIGSQALRHWQGKEATDDGRDIDVLVTENQLRNWGMSFEGKSQIKWQSFEFINIDYLNSLKICMAYADQCAVAEDPTGVTALILPPEALYILKRSHLYRPLKFARHISQLQEIKKLCTFPLPNVAQQLLKERTRLTKEQFKDRTPSLMQSNEDFFNDFVTKHYVHDDLHIVMAHEDEPMYEKMKRDKSLAKCDKDLWEEFSVEQQLQCVREECFVIGLERFIIPNLVKGERHMPAKFAFDKALEKVCTTLTSGWFRDFAIDNWAEIRDYKVDFLGKFNEAVASGQLKKSI